MSSTNTSSSTTVKLASVEHWSRWIETVAQKSGRSRLATETLRATAEGQSIWYKVDPDLPTEASDILVEPEMPGIAVLEQYVVDRTTQNHIPTMLEAIQFYHVIHQEACTAAGSTVNPNLHSSTLEEIRTETGRRQITLREITKKLKDSFSPGLMVLKAETSTLYKDLLEEARWDSTSPDKWIERWNTTYQKAVRHDINEIQGANAIHDFIQAVGANFEPTWAEAKKIKLVEYNNNIPDDFTLKYVSDEFMRYRKASRVYEKEIPKGAHATLGNKSDANKQDTGSKTKGSDCPCGYAHHYKPQQCRTLLFAVTGEPVNKKKTPEKELCAKIRQRYESPKWENLRTLIAQEGRVKSNTDQPKPKEQFPGKVSAAIIDPKMMMAILDPLKVEENTPRSVFTTVENKDHMLAQSTLFDNCGAMHVANNEALLEPGSFKLTFGDYLEAGTTTFPIVGRGTRIIKNILNGTRGPCTEDLVLNDVAIVRGFHVNIVSESKLIEKNIWYCGADSTLR
ncbi:hypothetical protein E4U59_000472, partial [Claviceps monticola]